jgi:hypothetical protein
VVAPQVTPLLALLRGETPRPPVAWDALIAAAEAHRLTTILARAIATFPPELGPPAPAAARLRARVAGVAARNMLLAAELALILRAAVGRGIRCAPLRGLALAARLHGDHAARPIGDLDLLAPKDALSPLTTLLVELGFREFDRRPGFARAFSYTLKLVKGGRGPVIIEPHWTIAYPPFAERVDMARVWARCRRGEVVGVETWLLGPEALLLHLALHVAHAGDRAPLLWIWEIDRLVRQEGADLDWWELVELAVGSGAAPLAADVLAEVRRFFATPIPDGVLEAFAAAPTGRAERRWARLLGDASVDGSESLLVLLTLDGLGAKLRYALALLFPSSTFMMEWYELSSRWQLVVAYARRALGFSWAGLRGLARLLVGGTWPVIAPRRARPAVDESLVDR